MSKVLDALRQAIERSGKSCYAIAKETSIDEGQLSRLMSGKSGVSYDNLERLLDCLGLEVVICQKRDSKVKPHGKHQS